MHGTPSTSSRTSPSCRSAIAVTLPRLSESGIDQRQRDVDHRVEVCDRDPLVRRVDVLHPVREIEALKPSLVEDVRVRRAPAQTEPNILARACERVGGKTNDLVVALEPVTAVRLARFD